MRSAGTEAKRINRGLVLVGDMGTAPSPRFTRQAIKDNSRTEKGSDSGNACKSLLVILEQCRQLGRGVRAGWTIDCESFGDPLTCPARPKQTSIMPVFGTSVLNLFRRYLWHTRCLVISWDRLAEGSAVLVQTAMRHLAAVNCTCIVFSTFPLQCFELLVTSACE